MGRRYPPPVNGTVDLSEPHADMGTQPGRTQEGPYILCSKLIVGVKNYACIVSVL